MSVVAPALLECLFYGLLAYISWQDWRCQQIPVWALLAGFLIQITKFTVDSFTLQDPYAVLGVFAMLFLGPLVVSALFCLRSLWTTVRGKIPFGSGDVWLMAILCMEMDMPILLLALFFILTGTLGVLLSRLPQFKQKSKIPLAFCLSVAYVATKLLTPNF